jgi:hypothetical protein
LNFFFFFFVVLKVSDLKEKINKEKGYPVSHQKLIYSGTVLDDNSTVASVNFKEGDFMVLMVRAPKPTDTKPATSTPAGTPSINFHLLQLFS